MNWRSLPEGQLARFDRDEVLRYTGAAGAERDDPWKPWEIAGDPPVDLRIDGDGGARLQGAIDQVLRMAAGNPPRRWHIHVPAGEYRGPVYVPRDCPPLTITCDPGARLSASIDAEMPGAEYEHRFASLFAEAHPASRAIFHRIADRETITTHNSGVLRVEADDVTIRGLTVVNSYNCDRPDGTGNARTDHKGRFGSGQHQAVAVHVAGADRVWLDGMTLSSFQDTLYLQHPGPFSTARTYLSNCDIEGDVDFIFGQATAYFEDCTLRARFERGADVWYTAPATNLRTPYGFVFQGCRFVSDEVTIDKPALLGRQWFESVRATPYGAAPAEGYRVTLGETSAFDGQQGTISRATLESVGKCVVLNSSFGDHLHPAYPWNDWCGGRYNAEGHYVAAPWHPRFRPVLETPNAMVSLLSEWLATQDLDYSDLDPDDVWLGVGR